MYNWLIVSLTLIIAFILTVLPLPEWAVWFRPAWVLMVLIYWAMTMPYKVSLGAAWVTGFIFDLLTGTMLGEHALAFTVVIYFVTRMHIRLRMYPSVQQGLSIFVFVLLYQFILYCIQGFVGSLPGSQFYWFSSLTSTLLWPWLFVLLRDLRNLAKIA